MFNNIGGKIKTLVKILTFLEIAFTFAIGCCFVFFHTLLGLLIMFLGPLFCWITSFFLYGFGQLIENSDRIANNTKEKNISSTTKDQNTENTQN